MSEITNFDLVKGDFDQLSRSFLSKLSMNVQLIKNETKKIKIKSEYVQKFQTEQIGKCMMHLVQTLDVVVKRIQVSNTNRQFSTS